MPNYVISDLHGCVHSFRKLQKKLNFSKGDELILLGDYFNKGLHSKALIDDLLSLKKEGFKISALWGNHDWIVYETKKGKCSDKEFLDKGGIHTLYSFGIKHLKDLPAKYDRWFDELKFYHETNEYVFTHAGLNFNLENPLSDWKSMLWNRPHLMGSDFSWLKGRQLIYGHTPRVLEDIQKDVLSKNKVPHFGIDGGCVYGTNKNLGQLCALELSKPKLYNVSVSSEDYPGASTPE